MYGLGKQLFKLVKLLWIERSSLRKMLKFSLREIKLSFKSWAWGISFPLYFDCVHGSIWRSIHGIIPLKLLAKVNSHAYVDLYFDFTWIVHEMLLKSFDACVTKRVCQCEGIIHVSLLRIAWFKAYVPFPPRKLL